MNENWWEKNKTQEPTDYALNARASDLESSLEDLQAKYDDLALRFVYLESEVKSLKKASSKEKTPFKEEKVQKGMVTPTEFKKKFKFCSDSQVSYIIKKYKIPFVKSKRSKYFLPKDFIRLFVEEKFDKEQVPTHNRFKERLEVDKDLQKICEKIKKENEDGPS